METFVNWSSDPYNGTKVGITFEMLSKKQVTNQQLLSWSAPIDLVERYQVYLENPIDGEKSLEPQFFHNCSTNQFGEYCQYSLAFIPHSFAENVWETFMWKTRRPLPQNQTIHDVTCYIHLKCDRGSLTFWCLDWREICDGKIDCLNDSVDEQRCAELELYECPTDRTYRCRNGQCIPLAFLGDSTINPDCQDKTDERDFLNDFGFWYECSRDPGFRCEEHTCYNSLDFPCGDGDCVSMVIPGDENTCLNHRGTLMSRSALAFSQTAHIMSYACWSAVICLTRVDQLFLHINCAEICGPKTTISCTAFVRQHCPSEFAFPIHPVVLGHVSFVYSNHIEYSIDAFDLAWTPQKVCYREQLCDGISHGIASQRNKSICQLFRDLPLQSAHYRWRYLTRDVQNLFNAACSATINAKNDTHCKQREALFQCPNSTKHISTRRLLDNVIDCVDRADENYNNSCSLQNQHRFQCKSDRNRCISSMLVLNGVFNCPDGEDEDDPMEHVRQQRINFPTLCDGFQERQNEVLDGQIVNDETGCEEWECSNQYTRCDGFHNCHNGADELDCTSSSFNCSFEHQPCLSPTTLTLFCLPLARVGDKIVDCLGASDERALCRSSSYQSFQRYRCWNCSRCLSPGSLCSAQPICEFQDDVRFCNIHGWNSTTRRLCDPAWNDNRSASEELLCSLNDQGKPEKVYFSLQSRRIVQKVIHPDPKTHVVRRRTIRSTANDGNMQLRRAWYCNRGILVNSNKEEHCLCPPAYYGHRCEYQNQRVSLTVQFLRESGSNWRMIFHILLILITDDSEVESHDSIIYVPVRDCNIKFNVYLLYRTRPKDPSKNYSVRIDAFDKKNLAHHASWQLAIPFPFLPVSRLTVQLIIPQQPAHISSSCPFSCLHGQCIRYESTDGFFCRCFEGWRGLSCHIPYKLQCSSDSISVDSDICVCPLTKFGPRCYLTRSSCQAETCKHNGLCVPADVRMAEQNFTCLCHDGYSGKRCEIRDTMIQISFKDLHIPTAIRAHFITVQNDSDPVRLTTFRKIPSEDNSLMLYNFKPFHLIFIEFDQSYYLSTILEQYIPFTTISNEINPSRRCLSIQELLNATLLTYSTLRRVKYYHRPCEECHKLICFYDDTFMCLCNADRHANCFEFDHNMTYDCLGNNYCENGAECYQDDSSCPTASVCVCPECFYGTYCQFTTKGFGLSLDAILGYHIRPQRNVLRQPVAVKVTAALTIVMLIVGLINGSLCTITFSTRTSLKMGCGFYLLASSITSLLTVGIFTLKFWLLFLIQMNLITSPMTLSFYCISMDFLLKFLLHSGDWFNACVAIERALTVWEGIGYDQSKRRQTTKWVIVFIVLATSSTAIHDPLHRHLINDVGEQRTWCIVRYSSSVRIFNTAMDIIHFVLPFSINIVSGLLIVVIVARNRTVATKRSTYQQHICEQSRRHKHLLISPCMLVILASPRLIIALISGCMKSARNPELFIAGYIVSFMPPVLLFSVFVFPSDLYMQTCRATIKRWRTVFCRLLACPQ